MRVLCKSLKGELYSYPYLENLTIGKWYEVLDMVYNEINDNCNEINNHYKISDDMGDVYWHSVNKFYTLSELRDIKLKELLDEDDL